MRQRQMAATDGVTTHEQTQVFICLRFLYVADTIDSARFKLILLCILYYLLLLAACGL